MSRWNWNRIFSGHSSPVPTIHRKPKHRPTVRPVLESLEDRLAPAVLTVNTLSDGGSTSQLTLREAVALIDGGGNPVAAGQSSMPAGWASQISGSFGSNDTIQFDPGLLTQNAGYGTGVLGLRGFSDISAGPSNLAIRNGINVTITGPTTGNAGITIEDAPVSGPMRLFLVAGGGSLTLENLTLANGTAQGTSGGLGSNGGGGGGGGSAGVGGAVFVEQGAVLNIVNSTLSGNTARGGNGAYSIQGDVNNFIGEGAGGGGLSYPGGAPPANNGGGPNGGIGYLAGQGHKAPPTAGFGGGGGGGSNYHGSFGANFGEPGGNGGMFGGGGGGGEGFAPGTYSGHVVGGGNGGLGGFGGGGGGAGNVLIYGGGAVSFSNGAGGGGGYGGGSGGNGNGYGSGSGGGGAGMGGAIFDDGGTVNIVNSTFTGNNAIGGQPGARPLGENQGPIGQAGIGLGGAIFNYQGSVTITNSTLVANGADRGSDAFNYASQSGTMAINNSILANSATGTADYDQSPGSSSTGNNNLILASNGFAGTYNTASPLLNPLANNGGPTQTFLPQAGSPAINAGNNNFIAAIAQAEGVATSAATDQNGKPRVSGGTIDIGSVEVQQLTSAPPPPTTAYGLDFLPLAATTTAGKGPGTIQVEVLNYKTNQVVTSDNSDKVTLSGAPFTAGNSLTATVHNGIATFNNVVIDQPGSYTLTATSGHFKPGQDKLTVVAAPTTTAATPIPTAPASAPSLDVPPLLEVLDLLLRGKETVNADGSVTVTDSWFGLPLLVSDFSPSGRLESVDWLGINVTLLFDLL